MCWIRGSGRSHPPWLDFGQKEKKGRAKPGTCASSKKLIRHRTSRDLASWLRLRFVFRYFLCWQNANLATCVLSLLPCFFSVKFVHHFLRLRRQSVSYFLHTFFLEEEEGGKQSRGPSDLHIFLQGDSCSTPFLKSMM